MATLFQIDRGPDVSARGSTVEIGEGASGVARALGNVASEARSTVQPYLNRRAEQRARKDAASGQVQQRAEWSQADSAYNRAMDAAYRASAATDIEVQVAEVLRDPIAATNVSVFSERVKAKRDAYVMGAPSDYAMEVAQAWDRETARRSIAVADAGAKLALETADARLKSRQTVARSRLTDFAAQGISGLASPDFTTAMQEYTAIQTERRQNPLLGGDQARDEAEISQMRGELFAAAAASEAMKAAEGKATWRQMDEAGQAVLSGLFRPAEGQPDMLSGLDPTERARWERFAGSRYNDMIKDRRAEVRAEEEAREKREADTKVAQRDSYATVSGALIGNPNAYSEATIEAMVGRNELTRDQANNLVRQRRSEQDRITREVQAQERQTRAAESQAQSAERTAQAAARSAAADERREQNEREAARREQFNGTSRARSDDIVSLTDRGNPDAAYQRWVRARPLMREGDDSQARSSIVAAYGSLDERNKDAMAARAPDAITASDWRTRYEARVAGNRFADTPTRQGWMRQIMTAPRDPTLRQATQRSLGGTSTSGTRAPAPIRTTRPLGNRQ